jgi:hypothetical protein
VAACASGKPAELVQNGSPANCPACSGPPQRQVARRAQLVNQLKLRHFWPDREELWFVELALSLTARRSLNAESELERLFAPLAGLLSDLSLAGGHTDEINPSASGLAARGRAAAFR